MKNLTTQIVAVNELTPIAITNMFALYSKYYAGTSFTLFKKDLAEKHWVFLLYDDQQKICGFSTLALFNNRWEAKPLRVLYSGDTIIDHQYWGQQQLALNWIRFAGEIKAQEPEIPLYWLLLVKGHRTYRYLSAFCYSYFPSPRELISPSAQNLIHKLGKDYFGNMYHASTGLVSYPSSHGHLREEWAIISEKLKFRQEVDYFLQRNPRFYQGDELVCLCELEASNLKPFARRLFNSIKNIR